MAEIAEVMPDKYRPMVWVSGALGLRRSEVIQLKVGCLDLEGGTSTVAESITRGLGAQLVTGPAKSSTGNRTVTPPSTIADLLDRHRSALGTSEDPDRSVAERLESRFVDGTETESTRAKIAPRRAISTVEDPETRISGGRNPR